MLPLLQPKPFLLGLPFLHPFPLMIVSIYNDLTLLWYVQIFLLWCMVYRLCYTWSKVHPFCLSSLNLLLMPFVLLCLVWKWNNYPCSWKTSKLFPCFFLSWKFFLLWCMVYFLCEHCRFHLVRVKNEHLVVSLSSCD